MTVLQPSVWFTLLLEKVPVELGTTVYRWAMRPMADEGSWKEARVIKWGSIERALSNVMGDYDVASTELVVSDADGLIRGLLADPSTRTFTSREAAIELLSEAGRAAGTDPRTLFRGRVTDVQARPGRTASLKFADAVGSHFSGFDLEQTVGVRITRAEHPNCGDDVVNRIYPIIIGEHSDVGVVDANGDPADKGVLPVVDVGDYLLAEDGTIVGTGTPLSYTPSPTGTGSVVNGTPDATTYSYGVTAVTPYGETTETVITVTTGAAALDGTDSITLSWDDMEPDGAVEYRVYGRDEPRRLLVRLNNNETFTAPETTWTDEGAVEPGTAQPPLVTTALTDQVVDGQAAFAWARLILKQGAAAEVQHLYASNLAAGTEPKRVRVAEARYGSEFLVYGRPGFPHSDPYIEINGIRMGVAYARGQALLDHRNGNVAITWNGCGDDDIGDGSGDTITEAFPALQHFFNEYRLKDGGVGYLTGAYGPLEEYSNGVAKLKTSEYDACQTLTVEWIGGRGYQASIAITEPTSLREIIRRFCVTFDCHIGANHHGQIYPVLVNDAANTTDGRLYHERVNVITFEGQDIDHDAVETRVVYHYKWDADASTFLIPDQILEDEDASESYYAARQKSPRACYYTSDADTALDSNTRHLNRYKAPPRWVSWRTDLTGLEDEVGTQVRLTHHEGAGGVNGDDKTPFLVFKHRTDPDDPEHVVLTALDLGRILEEGEALRSDPVGAETLVSSDTGELLYPSSGAFVDESDVPIYDPRAPGPPEEGGIIAIVPSSDPIYGMETRAMYGGGVVPVVVPVTNLNNAGIGSLRYAVENITVPRVVTFEISGYVDLADTIRITSPYITIAGATAPSPGITLRKYGIEIQTHDVFLQHFRVRPGEWGTGKADNCGIIAFGTAAHEIVLANMSVSWGPDENIAADKYGSSVPMNMTVYRCLSAESLDFPASVPLSAGHGMLVQAESKNVAMIQSLFANNRERNPYFQGDTSGALVNCVLYNWFANWAVFGANYRLNGSTGGGAWHWSVVNNVFIPGPNTDDDGGSPQGWQFYYDDAAGTPAGNQIYRSGNLLTNPLGITMTEEESELGYDPNVSAPPSGASISSITVLSTTGLETFVRASVGARPADRDAVDARIVAYVAARTAPGYFDHQDDVGGYPALAVNRRTLSLPADPHADSGNGYTNLEVWLQSYAAGVE